MHTDWQHFLDQHPPQSMNTIPTNTAIMPLSSWAIISVEGADASPFLQNLCTNDVNALAIDQAQLNGLCNPKGRLLAIFWLLRNKNGYQLILPKPITDAVVKRLSMYILRSDVRIKDQSETLILLGEIQAASSLSPLEGKQQDTGYSLRLPGSYSRTLRLVDPTQAIKLAKTARWIEETHWQQIDIASGLPFIFDETIEKFTPQQVNLDLLAGVSFSKGCYPGQEIVARLHYLGTPSRRLFSATAITPTLPKAGEEISIEDGNVVGHIVQAQITDGQTQILLSLKLSNQHQNLLLSDTTPLSGVTALFS